MGIVCWNKRLLITGNKHLQSSSWMRSTVLDLLVWNRGLAMVIVKFNVLMATNHINILDQALLKPDRLIGRLNSQIPTNSPASIS
ncbi:uncharacterized protein LOC131253451 isoform X7 [Magnolia sinica]|uniref:uncharacterized protein LOC131253451 isoform X7 n=1 Tax=Magnolia sinica TaxID=86752 RepID=UPI002658E7C3|nr:uncharacterized protein LOC131253451 isoform X7 [Magnolia sinica]